jgi:5'-nucleotidase
MKGHSTFAGRSPERIAAVGLAAALCLLAGHLLPLAAQEPAASTAAPAATRPRFLVTNDDGWEAPGLAALVRELARAGEVVVSAPAVNQSGSSQSLGALGQPVRARPVAIEGAAEAWAVEGTPAVAAAFGLLRFGAERPFDLVVSGINRGANVGDVAHVSGTVGAAMQAASMGVPAIASSQDSLAGDYAVAALYTAKVALGALERGLPVGVVLSINVPAKAAAGGGKSLALPMGRGYLEIAGFSELPVPVETASDAAAGTLWRPSLRLLAASAELAGSDTGGYLDGDITVTPLAFDWTAHDRLDWLRGWLPQP